MGSHPGVSPAGSHHTVMDGRAHAEGDERRFLTRLSARLLGRRRSYVVDPAYQLRSALIAVLGMIFLLLFAAGLFHLLSAENAGMLARHAPLLPGGSTDMRSLMYLLAVGLFFVAAVFAVEIFETHKTAGVVYKVTRGLREVEAGRWAARVTLRKHDNFKEMEEAFNAATRSLRDQLDDDLRGLQAIEGQVRLAAREFESRNHEGAMVMLRRVAADLQALRESRRNLLESAPRVASERKEG